MAKSSAQPILLGLFALALLGFLVKVVWRPRSNIPEHVQAPTAESYKISDAVDINVYLDSSGSIKHFLQDAPAGRGASVGRDASVEPRLNYVRDLLNKCEGALASAGAKESSAAGWSGNTARYWLFGERVVELPGEGALQRLSGNPAAFTAGNTKIEDPVTHTVPPASEGSRPELKIILTDLYQSGGALERPAEALVKKYLSNEEGAVGVMAVRNPLDGEVEDLPGSAPHETLHGAADTMPFYVIVAGLAPDVRHAMDTLLEHTRLKEAQEKGLMLQVFFSRKPPVRTTAPATIEGTDFSPDTDDLDGQGIKKIELPQNATVTARWPTGDSAPGRLVDLGKQARMTPSVETFDVQGNATPSPDGVNALTLCGAGPCVAIDGSKLTKGMYRIRLDRISTGNPADLEPDSLKPWNIERQDAERISRGTRRFPPATQADRPLTGTPGKTPDLSKFLSSLQGAMFHSPLHTASYFLYVQVD